MDPDTVQKPAIDVAGIKISWDLEQGSCSFADLPVAMMWVGSTLSGLLSGVQAMVGTPRFQLALQSEGRNSVDDDWQVISQYPNFADGIRAIAKIAMVAGWGRWELISIDEENKRCVFSVRNSWEGLYQHALGVNWGSHMLGGKLAGYCTRYFGTNCWAEQSEFTALGADVDTFTVEPSERSVEGEIEQLLSSDEATKADMAVALQRLSNEIENRKHAEKERIDLERQVQHAQKLESLGVLAGGIAHDFNNLLMGVLGHAELAIETLPVSSPAIKNLRGITAAAKQAAELTHQMLAYSGKGRFLVESLSVNQVIDEMTRLLEVTISKTAILRFDLAPDLPLVEADGSQLRQVIMNLITNAAEAVGDKSGVISINTGAMFCDKDYLSSAFQVDDLEEGLYVYVEVADTGVGMDKETLAKIFDPFFTTKFTGRGLGLAAVQGIVRGHSGVICVYSEPNQGTTFKILLPASESALSAFPLPPSQPHVSGSGIALLVDDEETVRAIGRLMLESIGFEVMCADDGPEAVEIYREHRDSISFVLLDLTMPHMTGEEVFRELRQIDKNVRVVLSSGYNHSDITQRFAGKGLAGFIQKPYGREGLSEVLKAALPELRQREDG